MPIPKHSYERKQKMGRILYKCPIIELHMPTYYRDPNRRAARLFILPFIVELIDAYSRMLVN